MNKNLLFFNINAFESFIFSTSKTLIPNPGLLYISSFLKTKGFIPHIYDMTDYDCLGKTHIEEIIQKLNPLFLGISVTADNRQRVCRLVNWLKEKFPGLPVILGGPEATLQRSALLGKIPADISVMGEGEYTSVELAGYFSNERKKLAEIPGICFRKGPMIVETADRPFIEDLDQLPFPDYEMIENKGERNYRYLLVTGRGCKFRCAFCAQEVWKHTIRERSINNVILEIMGLQQKAGGKIDIAIVDDCFITSPERMEDFCRELTRCFKPWENLTWTCEARVDILYRHQSLLTTMKKAGLRMIQVGLESADEGQLKKYNKKIKLAEFEAVIHKCREVGIGCVYFNIIMGGPDEDQEIFSKNIEFVKEMYRMAPGIVECGSPFLALYKETEISKNPGNFGLRPLDENIDYTLSMADVAAETEKLGYKEIMANKIRFSREIEETMIDVLPGIPFERILHIFNYHSPVSYYKLINRFPHIFSYCRRLSSLNNFRIERGKTLTDLMTFVPSRMNVKWSYPKSCLTLDLGYKKIELDNLETQLFELCAGKLNIADIMEIVNRQDHTCPGNQKVFLDLLYKLQDNFLVTFSEI